MRHTRFLLAAAALLPLASAAFADPPTRVGRISYVEGGVSLRPPADDQWIWATPNYPLAQGEAVWTADAGRIELGLDRLELWLDAATEIEVTALDEGRSQFTLNQGVAELRVWQTPEGGLLVNTPVGPVFIGRPGLYRLDVEPPGDSPPHVLVTVFDGEAGAPGPDGPMTVGAGQSVGLHAGEDPQWMEAATEPLDDWARSRESQQTAPTANADPADMTGAGDLNAYGDYQYTEAYGDVWFPRDRPAGWAPYSDGRWEWVEPWGWTWVDNAPWGFAPFHYGRWVQIGGRWGWVRGPHERHPVYAPALVTFLGDVFALDRDHHRGDGGDRSWNRTGNPDRIGNGNRVGWVPLAPGEAFQPRFQASDDYLRRMNASRPQGNDTSQGANTGRPRNAAAAVYLPAEGFGRGPVKPAAPSAAANLQGSKTPPPPRPPYGTLRQAPSAGASAAGQGNPSSAVRTRPFWTGRTATPTGAATPTPRSPQTPTPSASDASAQAAAQRAVDAQRRADASRMEQHGVDAQRAPGGQHGTDAAAAARSPTDLQNRTQLQSDAQRRAQAEIEAQRAALAAQRAAAAQPPSHRPPAGQTGSQTPPVNPPPPHPQGVKKPSEATPPPHAKSSSGGPERQ
jgi:hypothetical protein